MTQEQKRQEIAKYLAGKGIIAPADVEAEISKMGGMLAASVATQKGLTTDVDKAYEVMMTEKGAATPAPTQTTEVVAQPTDTVSAAEKLAITKKLAAEKQDRAAVSANSSIEKLILDRPAPADQIPAGTKGIIAPETWDNIEKKWAGKIVTDTAEADGFDSMANYNALAAAAKNGTPVDVYIGELNKKSIGYMMNVGTAVGSGNAPVQMTREDASNFLTLQADGFVLAGDTTPGLKLRYVKAKASKTNPGQWTEAKTVLAEANKAAAIEAGNYVVSREVDSANVKETGLKSALCFRVDTGKPKANGEGNITKVVRVTVKAAIPQLVRKNEFINTFGTGERQSNGDLKSIPEGKQAQDISIAQQNAIAALCKKLNDPEHYNDVSKFADQLKAFTAPAGNVAPNATL